MIVKTTDPERVFFYCDKDSLMGAGLFERAKLERKSDAEKTTDQVLVGRVAAALD